MPNWNTASPRRRTPKESAATLESLIEDIPVAPFDASAGKAYGPIRLATRDSRAEPLDKLIAALGMTVVTNNLRDFVKYPGVAVENWLTSRHVAG
jgi:tRNA(fMet)-specific endonuclease VapC